VTLAPARRRRVLLPVLTGLTAAALVAPLLAGGPAASAAPAKRDRAASVGLTPLGTYRTGTFDVGGSEIVAYDPRRERAFSINAQAGTVDVIDISRPARPRRAARLDAPGANSVSIERGTVAVAQQATVTTDPGRVSFFDARTLRRLGAVRVGSLPDMVTLTSDGKRALVANEGEPEGYCDGQVDPVGSVSVIDLRRGVRKATVRTAGFQRWNGRAAQLRSQGIRLFGPGASVAQDIEPEYVTLSSNGRRAWVSLQENNALAVVDVRRARVLRLLPLGLKDHAVRGNGLDASDRDDAVNIRQWPVRGMYQPDGISAYRTQGREYLVTANEGDAREYDCFAEEERVADLTLDPEAFPDAEALQADEALGRLTVTTTAPQGAEGYTELHAFGGRSLSVRDARGRLVYDSGNALERLTSQRRPAFFNADHAENGSTDSRSDNKGPEPEGVDTGQVGGRKLAFLGLERNSGIAVFDVTRPARSRIVGYALNRNAAGDPEAGTAGDLGPEGLHFVPARQSPNRKPLLLVGNEVSGTVTVWQVRLRR
jgi:hypothetical protein